MFCLRVLFGKGHVNPAGFTGEGGKDFILQVHFLEKQIGGLFEENDRIHAPGLQHPYELVMSFSPDLGDSVIFVEKLSVFEPTYYSHLLAVLEIFRA